MMLQYSSYPSQYFTNIVLSIWKREAANRIELTDHANFQNDISITSILQILIGAELTLMLQLYLYIILNIQIFPHLTH